VTAVAPLTKLIVEIDGDALEAGAANRLLDVRVTKRLSLPSQCELTFLEPGGALGDGSAPSPGARLRVYVEDGVGDLFAGEVTALEYGYEPHGGSVVRIRGYDVLHRLRKRQPVRAHVEVTAAGLARDLVADLGLTVQSEQDGPLWSRIIQFRQSDFDLLADVAERAGLYFTIDEQVLELLTLRGSGEPLTLTLGETLLEARLEINSEPACRSVAAVGWDPSRGEMHEGSATSARVGRDVSAEAPPDRFDGDGKRSLVDELAQNDQQTDALAQAELDARLAREVTFWGVAEGDPRLRPGLPVDVVGVAERLAGRYVLTSVVHTVHSERGFLSELSTAPTPPHPRPQGAVVAPAVVRRVDDPEGLGRVQVALPSYAGVETDWLGVAMAGAGAGKGLVILPNVDDHVLVLFARENPAHGIVLGGLYGTNRPPDESVAENRVRSFAIVTPGGQRIRLDDTGNAIRVENKSGSYVELTPDHVVLRAKAKLTIDASGHGVTVRGKQIDFEQA